MKVPVDHQSLKKARLEQIRKEERLKNSVRYRLAEHLGVDLVGPEDRKAIEAKLKRTLGTPGPLLSSNSKFAFK